MNRLSVLSAITSTQQRLKLYNRVPTNGLVLYCGTVLTEDGKEKQVWARAAARMAPLAGLCAGHHMLRMPLSGAARMQGVRGGADCVLWRECPWSCTDGACVAPGRRAPGGDGGQPCRLVVMRVWGGGRRR